MEETYDTEEQPFEVGADEGVESSNPADESQDDAEQSAEQNGDKKNFIVNLHGLPWSANVEDVASFLEGCTIVGDKDGVHFVIGDDGRRNGDAIVELASGEDLKTALSKHNEHIGRRYIEVFEIDRYESDYVRKRSEERMQGNTDDPDPESIVRLRGLPWECTKEEIATFFLGLPIAPNGIIIVTDHQGRAAGDGYVKFSSPELVDKALEKNKEKIGHRYIEVFRSNMTEMQKRAGGGGRLPYGGDRPGPYDRPGYDRGYDRGYGGYMGRRSNIKGQYGDDYGGRYGGGDGYGGGYSSGGYGSRYESSRYGGGYGGGGGYGSRYSRDSYGDRDRYGGGGRESGSCSVHMRGLPFSASEDDISRFFQPLRLVHISMDYNRDGRPSGDADVEFASPSVARDALKRHKANMGSRYIELSLNGPSPYGYSRR